MNTKAMPKDLKDKVIGPNGEIRPRDPIAHQTVAFDVLTGHREEEYISEEHKRKAEEKKLDEERTIFVPNPETGELEIKVTTRRELMENPPS